MIYVDRKKVAKPKILEEAFQKGKWKGKTERQAAIAYFTENQKITGFGYWKRYSSREVRAALIELFSRKCAYCETAFMASSPIEVEHYRPKSVVLVQDDEGNFSERYGYYWLSADWENLLLSCIDCNRQRYHETSEDEEELGGKKNLFPVIDEEKRAKRPGEEKNEEKYRLLLDPCRDHHPEEHLEFTEEGIVKPAIQSDGQVSKMGEETLRVYGLWRPYLKEQREIHCRIILDQISRIDSLQKLLNDLVKKLQEEPDDNSIKQMKKSVEQLLELEMGKLREFQSSEKPYAGMVRQIVKKHFPNFS